MGKKTVIDNGKLLIISIFLFIIIILLSLFIIDRYGLVDIFGDGFEKTNYTLPEVISCTEFHIGNEYKNAYGIVAIDFLEDGCNNLLGVYTFEVNEFSCFWDSRVHMIDCNTAANIEFGRFCIEELKGFYVCNPEIAYLGCHCNQLIPDPWYIEDNGDNGGYDEQMLLCTEVVLPEYGDLGGICRESGYCLDPILNCEHYWDYNDQIHRCDCTEASHFCGQYCFSYYYTVDCECPPDSYREIITRSTFQCVPNGHTCFEGNVV